MEKTKNYEMFIFRDDNRERIDLNHVEKIKKSIQSKNLLDLRPIDVNENMEVMDGQHRLLAAKDLDLEIYYRFKKGLEISDIILMNTSKSWRASDYLNFFCKNNYPQYLKLKKFMDEYCISLRISLSITSGSVSGYYEKFKSGDYIFSDENTGEDLSTCWETIAYIKKINGYSSYTESMKFWTALINLVTHEDFNKHKWMLNIKRFISRFTTMASKKDYCNMFMEVHNWRNPDRIKEMVE